VGQNDASGTLVLASSNGRDWKNPDFTGVAGSLGDVAFGNGTIVAVGPGQTSNTVLMVKPSAGDWQVQRIGTNNEQILFGNGVFLSTAGGEPGARISTDGVAWTSASPDGSWFAFDGTRFVSFGAATSAGAGQFRTSTDGVAWSAPAAGSYALSSVTALAKAGEQVVGFGLPECARLIPSSPAGSAPACFQLELLGSKGSLPELLTATPNSAFPVEDPALDSVKGIAANDVRVVVISTRSIYAATLPLGNDGAGWTRLDVAARGWALADVSYRAGTFVAVGQSPAPGTDKPHPLIVTSLDGVLWSAAAINR